MQDAEDSIAPQTAKATRQPRSFLQGLTKKFGPNLVGEYLRTQNLTRMRRLIKLEQSQHCQCEFREQMTRLFAYQQSQAEKSQMQQVQGETTVPTSWSVMQDQARESQDVSRLETENVTEGPPQVTAKPCKNCLTQSNFADLLCRVYNEQV